MHPHPEEGKRCFPPKAIHLCPYRYKGCHWPYWSSLSWHSSRWQYIFRSGIWPRTRPLGNTRYCQSHGCPTRFQENERNSPKYRTCNDRPKNRPHPVHNSRTHWCPPHKFFLGSRSQNGTHIGSIVQWKHIPDITIKLHHTVLVGEIHPLVIIGCYLPSLGPLTINTFIKIDDKAIPAGNYFDQREKKKKAEKR